jgi:hypothetical protein
MMFESRFNRALLTAAALLSIVITASSPAARAQGDDSAYRNDPVPLVRDASYNELKPSNAPRYRYQLRKTDEKGTSVKEIIETPEGDVARLLSREDKPITGDALQAETDRLNNLFAHPEIQARRHKKEQEDSGHADNFIKLLPDAFVYQYQDIVDGTTGPAYRLTFVPNPKFNPPNREAEVYHGMAGELWIDVKEKRMVRFDAHIIQDVDFGWGIVGRLFKGGTIQVQQEDVGGGRWEATSLKLNLTIKILMVKTMLMHTTEISSDFVPVPPGTDYKGAITILKSLPPPMQ